MILSLLAFLAKSANKASNQVSFHMEISLVCSYRDNIRALLSLQPCTYDCYCGIVLYFVHVNPL